jgi:hypothetical protein
MEVADMAGGVVRQMKTPSVRRARHVAQARPCIRCRSGGTAYLFSILSKCLFYVTRGFGWGVTLTPVAHRVQADIDEAALQILAALDRRGVKAIFPECALPQFSLIELHLITNEVRRITTLC